MNFSQLNFGYFAFKIHGIFVALAFLIAAWHFYKQVQKNNLSVDFFLHHFWRWVVGGVLIGRLVVILLHPEIVVRNGWFSFFTFWDGEIDFFGAFIGGAITAVWDLKVHKFNIWRWADTAVGSFLIAIVLIDLSGFLTGAVYGTPTSLPWGVQYQTFGVATLAPVHPVTLYAFVLHVGLMRWVVYSRKFLSRTPGKLFFITTLLFFVLDFFLQFLHGEESLIILKTFRIEQVFDLGISLLCLIGLRKK